MTDTSINLVIKDYDFLAPLAAGDFDAAGIQLNIDRDTSGAIDRMLNDGSVDAGELSFMRHIIRIANGDRSFVGIPIIPTRGFRQRCFFVNRDSEMSEFEHLQGKRIGTNEWPATGNTWSRAVLRERGVDIDSIDWWVGPVDDPDYEMRPQGELPQNVRRTDQTLLDRLYEGELDALMCPRPPDGLYDDAPIVRLKPNYREVEKEYYRRTGIYPIHHLIGLRRDVFENDPSIAESLFNALDKSKSIWYERRRRLSDTTPWMKAEIEETIDLIGTDWHPNGIEPNRREIETLCDEAYAQGLVDKRLTPHDIFQEYEGLTGSE